MINPKLQQGRIRQITVIGDAQINDEGYLFAEKIGREIANLGYAVVTGGRSGIMEAANKGAFNAGGISIGILPSSSIAEANQYCNIVIPTGLGHARNVITALACDAVISIGGGAGTLSEICFGWIYNKPIFVFEEFDGWSKKVAGQPIDDKYFTKIMPCHSIEDLVDQLGNL